MGGVFRLYVKNSSHFFIFTGIHITLRFQSDFTIFMSNIIPENIRKVAEGDELAFQEFFMEYYPSLRSFALRYVDQDMVAEDLVQDVFVKIWETRSTLKNIDDFSAYVYQMVRFKCFNYLRSQKIRDNAAQSFTQEQDIQDADDYVRDETYRLVMKAVDELPPACRQVFLLAMQGYAAKEIADQLNIAVETVKKQKQIARKVLKEKLGNLLLFIMPLWVNLFSE